MLLPIPSWKNRNGKYRNRKRVTQKPFRMTEGSLSSFAAIKLIYVELTVILLKIKKITVVFMANVYYI